MVCHWSLSDSKSPQVSMTRLRILAVLSNTVMWIFSTYLPTSKSSRPFNNPLVIVPKAPITIGTIVTFMFHSFFNSLARSRYLSFFSHSFSFILWSVGTATSTILQILFFSFLLIIIRSGILAGIRWSVCKLKSHRSLCVLFSRTGAILCMYHLLVWSNLNFLHILLLLWSLLLLLFTHWEIFTLVLADGFSLESERWQVSSSLQDSSQYSGRSQWCSNLNGLYSSSSYFSLYDQNFLYISQWITLPTQSCLVLYSFCANLLHSLILWLMVSSLSPHSLHLLFCCVLSILALIWLVLMALFWAAIRSDSVSLLKFPFLSHLQVLSCEILFISRLKRPLSCFPSHFCFLVIVIVVHRVIIIIVSNGCNQFSIVVFEYSLRVVVSMRRHSLHCWQVLFLPLFLKHYYYYYYYQSQ